MNLKFGTGGLRARMAPGPDYLNTETIQEATLGVAAYAKTLSDAPSLAISYDSRRNSKEFSLETARVLALKGCEVYIYPTLMPTPALSFAVRYLKCTLGIAITASHNPKEYNGYKVYGPDGCQITGDAAKKIQKEIEKAQLSEAEDERDFDTLLKEGKILWIGEDTREAFFGEIKKLRTMDGPIKNLSAVYTPLNGAGVTCVPEILKAIGMEHVYPVPEQMEPDGEFPTCPYPNPEEDEALVLGLEYCKKHDADLLLATDPDSDRVGVAAKKGDTYERFTGNQVGVLMLDYLLKWHTEHKTMPENPVLVKTIVTTTLAEKIAERYGVRVINVLTGFKYIGEQIGYLEASGETERYVFGLEESCGYLIGTYVRDKDAVGAVMLICEMAETYKSQGKTLWDALEEIYEAYGEYETELHTQHFEADEAKKYMEALRSDLKSGKEVLMDSSRVINYADYSEGLDNLPKSDVLKVWLENGTEIVIRPSGTEPKIKIYKEIVKS